MNSIEKFQGFENWLKANGYVTSYVYLGYMRTIDKTLFVKDFERITSTALLQKLFDDLKNNRSFAARSKSDRDNILSGFRTYILYMQQIKK
jgi:hypothetical protein